VKHLGLDAALAMATLSIHASKRRSVAVNKAPRQQTEVEAWNAAVEARKAEKKARKATKDYP